MSKAKSVRYNYVTIGSCNMCGSGTHKHRVLGKRLNASQGRAPWKKTGMTTTVCKCEECGLIFSNPQPIPYDIQDHYGVPPDDYWLEEYFTVNDDYFMSEIKTIGELMPGQKGLRSLDIGAGLGKQMIALSRAGFDAYGFEPSRSFHEKAITSMNMDPARLKLARIEDAKYPAAFFDIVSFGAVLEHLYDPSDAILKALHWLKPNGLIHIEVPSSDWLVNKIINLYYSLKGSDYIGNLSPMHPPYHLYEFSLGSFKKHAEIHGYGIARYEYFVCQTYMPKVLDPLLRRYMQRTNTGMQLSIWLRK